MAPFSSSLTASASADCQAPIHTSARYCFDMEQTWGAFLDRVCADLRDRRIAAGQSFGDVARAIGVTRPAVHQWETRASNPSPETLERWARHLGASIDYTFGVQTDAAELPAELQQIARDLVRVVDRFTPRELRFLELMIEEAGHTEAKVVPPVDRDKAETETE